jgi:hypothetical protein
MIRTEPRASLLIPTPGANRTIAGYTASAVKKYNATRSLVLFENQIIFFYFE